MSAPEAMPPEARRAAMRLVGWALVLGGLGVLSWLAWMVLATNATTKAAQEDLLEEWLRRGEAETPVIDGAAAQPAAGAGGPVAVMEFLRDGRRILHDEPVVVVAGVTAADLTKGPGHYPGSALPGGPGNMAIAGHRTTYGAPFADIDRLAEGDEIRVEDGDGVTWTYRVVEQRIVEPSDTTVIASDPLGNGRPTLTLTTCHPRYSNRQRLVVFAQLAP
ncbi:MAG TPA: class E sortase [Egibacteraceae bacterium]|nr:class E sortase [Egibacteraceae bacterium]